ncbi:T9SS type A sorting domain-containing protein [Phaeocystidibacter marisrubri]|uniref:T9SS type A sorting domain-containing protein n=1 Tax=Phaeocystidibacter marisrubri TaxID=1577780 RepID=A0A6L3ZFF3_9FLAO|nr:T9SS type A sorting domain-containing protein [Phaeocystidibacter marisrubri]KAB2816611.1 T9SS type A sorting domain-containing protein [Phaeocystidibacter marisrubri]GGH69947.1 hypothetical protein GCM10011318_11480 [Phaeocystidibacter marisrubri]
MVSRSYPWHVFSFFVSSLISTIAFSQNAPGGVDGQSLWHAQTNLPSTIGNHHTFNLLDLENEEDLVNLQGASTLFFVLKPKSLSQTGGEFMGIGDIRIFDDHIQFGRVSSPIRFTEDVPAIVTIETVASQRYARQSRAPLTVGDTSLFEIAELVIYPKSLSREERRKVNSYLALKYSITVTHNEDEIWRDYLRADNYTYWNRQIDGSHHVRVLGVGRLDQQQFLQTQTITTRGPQVLVALDEVKSIGTQPNVEIEDDAFIILSESKQQRSQRLSCSSGGHHPLSQWKLQLQNWNSTAHQLIVRIPLHEKSDENDSLFLTDGSSFLYLPKNVLLADEEYQIPLILLENYRHYYFTTKSIRDCDRFTAEVTNNELTVSLSSEEEEKLFVEVQDMSNGSSIRKPYENHPVSNVLGEGQYLVKIVDENGNMISSKVIANTSSTEAPFQIAKPTIRLFPDPASRGQRTTLSVQDITGDHPLKLTLSDMQGHVLEIEDLPFASSFDWKFDAPEVPGIYTLSLYSGEITYTVKLIVAQ